MTRPLSGDAYFELHKLKIIVKFTLKTVLTEWRRDYQLVTMIQ
jgi:hypothetical protein